MRGQALAVAGAVMAASLAVAPQASAQQYRTYHDAHVSQQQYCSQRRNNNTAGGAVIGSIVGAVLGSQAASRGHRTDGSVLGAVVGGVAGAAIGRDNARCDERVQGNYDPYYGESQDSGYYGDDPYARDDGFYPDDRDLRGGRDYGRGDNCRVAEVVTHDRRGRPYREEVLMCRGRDGGWYEQERY